MNLRTNISGGAPVLTLGALIGLAGCEDPVALVQQSAGISVTPLTHDFGEVRIGETAVHPIFINNTGQTLLTVALERSETSDPAFGFDIDLDTDRNGIVPDGVATMEVTFTPVSTDSVTGVVLVSHDVAEVPSPIAVELTGRGITSNIQVSPTTLDFGNVVVDTVKTLSLDVTNVSNVDGRVEFIRVDNVKLCSSGRNEPGVFCVRFSDQTLDENDEIELDGQASATVEVQYAPVVPSTPSFGSFILKTCETTACEVRVSLTGQSVEAGLRCVPDSLDFGQVNPGGSSAETVVCENIANDPITLVTWGITADSDPGYSTSRAEPRLLDPGASASIDVVFAPTGLGDANGTLRIETDDRNVEVVLSGTGGGPNIQALPETLNFGRAAINAPARRSVVVTNTGFSTLRVTDVQVDTLETGSFFYDGEREFSLEQNESRTIQIELNAAREGDILSGVRFISNDADEPELEIEVRGVGVLLPPCDFTVVPAQLNFGTVTVTRSFRRAFEIRNNADPTEVDNLCLITGVQLLPGTDPAFSLPAGDIMSREISPGASEIIEVDFSPVAQGTFTGMVEFSISSPTSPYNTVNLTGVGADSQLLIVPNELDFGTIGVGCASRDRAITIYNTGGTPVQIDAIELAAQAHAAFSLANRPAPLPASALTLNAGQSVTFDVGFRADLRSAYAGAVEIAITEAGAQRTYVVSLRGRGDIDARQIDEFEQLGKPTVDILFVIDNSCSMGQEQSALAANFQAFIQFAEAQGLDYQIGVTTTDTTRDQGRLMPTNGPAQNRIVTPRTTPSPQTVFSANANVGTGGSASERGLQAAEQALTAPNIFGHNAGLVRSDAVLSLIFISDEPDQSPGNIDYYINFFLSIKGFRNTNLFSASAITAPVPPGATNGSCSGPGGSASATGRYIAVAERTGGVFQSICTSDWSRSLEDLSTTAFGFKSRFFLTNQPVPATIEVQIDGLEVPATGAGGTFNWTYDFSTNSINFAPYATPEPGSQIRVEYTAECL